MRRSLREARVKWGKVGSMHGREESRIASHRAVGLRAMRSWITPASVEPGDSRDAALSDRFLQLQAQQHFQVFFISGQRLAQLTLEILVTATVQLRAELGNGALVKRNLLHDEIRTGA